MTKNSNPPIRWWPAALILASAALGTIYAWWNPEATGRQERVMTTGLVVVLTGAALFLWFLLLSRVRWALRLRALAGLAIVGGLFVALFEIRGVTGDLVPILYWRWGGDGDRLVAGGGGRLALGGRPASPQFLGPERTGVIPDLSIDPDWSTHPPVELWRREIGEGFAAFAVVGDLAVTQEQRGERELVVGYERDTGEVRWVHEDAARYSTAIAGTGPRATPTVAGDRVFTVGATGILNALDLETGRRLWRRDLIDEHGGTPPTWGVSISPLVVDGLVVVSAGGPNGASLVAYEADSGELAWSAGDDAMSFSAPSVIELAGERQIVQFNAASVAGHRVATGELLWSYPWSRDQPNVAQPLALGGDRLLVSSGYGIGSELLRISTDGEAYAVESLWSSTRLKAKFATPVLHEGYVYGLDDGVLACIDPATGERRWKKGRYGHGQVLLVDGVLLIQAEDGDIVLVEANPDEARELARLDALDHRTWNPPTLAGDQLFVRNDREAVAYRIAM